MAILIFDFDSTLVAAEGLDELFAASLEGATDRDDRVAAFNEITDLGMSGLITAEDSLARRLAILAADRELVMRVGASLRERLTPSVARNLEFFRENKERIYVVSGGFEELIHPTLDRIGIPVSHTWAHRFRYNAAGVVVGVDSGTVLFRAGKSGALDRIDRVDSTRWMIGDGATDLEVRQIGLVDRFVAFTEVRYRETVVSRADHVVRSMEELINLEREVQ